MDLLSALTVILVIFAGQSHAAIFPKGVQFDFSLNNVVVINDLNAGDHNSSVEVRAGLRLTTLWESDQKKLLEFTLLSPTVHRLDKHFSLTQTPEDRFLVEFDKNGPNIYLPETDTVSMRNLKKGLASIFQFFPENTQEIDVCGECSVVYEEISDRKFVKRKIKCKIDDQETYNRKEEPLGILTPNARNTEYYLDVSGSIEKIENVEFFRISLAGNSEIGATVDSRISLTLTSQQDAKDRVKDSLEDVLKDYKNYRKSENFFLEKENLKSEEKSENILQVLKKLKKRLANEKIGTEFLSQATVKLVQEARKANTEDLNKLISAKGSKEIKGQIIDILGASQTIAAHNAAKKSLDFKKLEDFPFVERYLQSLAVGSQPKVEVIKDLLEVLKADKAENPKLTETLVQTISSMTYNYASLTQEESNLDILKDVQDFYVTKIEKTTSAHRKLMFLRGLTNMRSKDTIPLLMNIVLTEKKPLAVVAMKALVSMPRQYFTMDHVKNFEDIYHQRLRKFDSSLRTMAVEILLDALFFRISGKDLILAIKTMGPTDEVKQFLLQKIKMESEINEDFRSFVAKIFNEDPKLNNYNILGTKALSTALSRKFLTYPSFNSSLISVQEIDKGILKRGIVDMTFESKHNKFSYFTIGLYADGLSSFVGSSNTVEDEDPQEEEPAPTAGMELLVQGNYLRPLVFFNGQGELMGHVWSGTASELTPAYQATTLLHDHREVIWLQNGLPVTIDLMGAMSINLNGQVSLSIWYKNANSRVLQKIGLAVTGKVSIDSSWVQLTNEFTMQQQPTLDLVTDIDFSGDPLLCMQLSQPNSLVKITHTKTEDIEGLKRHDKHEEKIKYIIPGYTHVLNRKNNEICNQIHSNKDN